MGYYRWKPNAAQRKAYAAKMRESEEQHDFIDASGAIRTGCYVEYVDKATNTVISGYVQNDSYGLNRNQHTFTICNSLDFDALVKVKGRNLYDRILSHKQGEISKIESR